MRQPTVEATFSPPSAESPKSTRVIVIGLDSADRGLIEQWCASGDLPVLQSLRKRGAYGHLDTPPGLGDDAVWATFYTGVSPGRHGRFYWRAPMPGDYRSLNARDRSWPVSPFWADLSRAGKRIAVLDIPKCPLVPGLNGIQLADWQTHGRDYPATCSWPPEFAANVLSRFGDDTTDRPMAADFSCCDKALPDPRMAEFLARQLELLRRKTQLAVETLEQDAWDLFLIGFKNSHCVGHKAWHLLAGDSVLGNPIKQIYQALDHSIGELVRRAGPETHVMVFSDLGMSSNETAEHMMDQILLRLEAKLATPEQKRRMAARTRQRFLQSPSATLKSWLNVTLGRADEAAPTNGAHRAERLMFHLEHNEIGGAIRINLLGREALGVVQPGEEYQRLCEQLTEELLLLRDPTSGHKLVDRVLSIDQQYPGPMRDRLPDLLAVWNREHAILGAASESIGTITPVRPNYRVGNHVPGGCFLAVGPGIAPGTISQTASIVDLAPTIAAWLDTPLSQQDGSPIPELIPISHPVSTHELSSPARG
jgi:predicted AlkP superfamily phosphohydrolase/phosphomutase